MKDSRLKLKRKAREIRGEGKTYSEIQNALGKDIPQSTLSNWCKDVKLPEGYQEKIEKLQAKGRSKGREVALAVKKMKRQEFLNELQTKNEDLAKYLNKDVSKLLLSILYLGEGGKHKSGRKLSLGNSDPKVIKFYLNLLRKCFSISEDKLRARVQCRADQDVKKLEEYWHEVTGIPLSRFHKTQVDERTIGKETKRKDYKGVCVIVYFDTEIQLELETLAQQIMEWT